MRPPEGRTLAHLQAIVAFMDSHECSQMELPLKVWRLTRDFAMTFHAFWSDGRTEVSATRQEICALLMHTTPYRRLPLIPNATEELTDVMAYAKTSMPWVSALRSCIAARVLRHTDRTCFALLTSRRARLGLLQTRSPLTVPSRRAEYAFVSLSTATWRNKQETCLLARRVCPWE